MKIKEVSINNFKRFTNLTIKDIPASAKLVLLVGPNGSGKTSVFEAFNYWYKLSGFNNTGDIDFYIKDRHADLGQFWFSNRVDVKTYDTVPKDSIRGKFYFRTAHRNEPSFDIRQLSHQDDPSQRVRRNYLMETDVSVSQNYQRLVSDTLAELYNDSNDAKNVKELREELIGKIRASLTNVFDDLQFSGIGNPLSNGCFYFTKGTTNDFHYKNLSAGEKSAFDLILDLVINAKYFPEGVYCIDEPELHMHTALQAKLLQELYSLIPATGQMWLATHSIGMLKQAKEIEEHYPGTVVFIDFSDADFDADNILTPAIIDATIWKKFLDLAFDDFSKLIAPETIVFCEGNPAGRKNQKFDEQVYQKIFRQKMPPVCFVSIGSCNDLLNADNMSMKIINQVMTGSSVIKVVDRDSRSTQEIAECQANGIQVLSKRNLESYLLDDEIIKKLCDSKNMPDIYPEIISIKQVAIESSQQRGNPADDIKSAAGDIVNAIRKKLRINNGGNSTHAFLRDTIAEFITPDTAVYKQLEQDIFGK